MENIQTILALASTILGIILVFLKIFETWVKVSGPVKNFLSNRKVWLVIAALFIVGIILFICRDRGVVIRTTHSRYVTVDEEFIVRAGTEIMKNAEKFTLLCLDDGKVALQSSNKKNGNHRLVTALGEDWDWILTAETTELLDFEIFTLVDVNTEDIRQCLEVVEALKQDGETRVAFLTFHNRFVTAMDGEWYDPWILRAETFDLLASEIFTLILLPSP